MIVRSLSRARSIRRQDREAANEDRQNRSSYNSLLEIGSGAGCRAAVGSLTLLLYQLNLIHDCKIAASNRVRR